MSRVNQYRLWTPIANAFEAYRRRLITEPKAFYEHTWRLVHIHESLIVTLGTALATRLLSIWKEQNDASHELKSLQELVTGRKQDDNDSSNESANRGCLGGNIGTWIDLLNRFGRSEIQPPCPFITAVKTYLEEVPDNTSNNGISQSGEPLAFLPAWRRIAPVPNTFLDRNVSRIGRFNAINTLRNKLAHVPISGRILEELHTGLRQEVISLLNANTNWQRNHATSDLRFTSGWHSPLCGEIGNQYACVTGSDFGQPTECNNNSDIFVYFKWCQSNNAEPIQWSASPFIHFDDELKVSLLFRLQRLDDEKDLPGEYYRFAAEVEPVQVRMISQETISPWLRVNTSSSFEESGLVDSYQISENATTAENQQLEALQSDPEQLQPLTPYQLRSEAEKAFKQYNYPLAVKYFDKLSEFPQSYNDVAMSKHGAALWRTATRQLELGNDKEKQISEMKRAVDLLEKAAQHRDVAYQARAIYEKSKAQWHLLDFVNEPELLHQAIQDAKKAAELGYESAYISWYQKLLDTPRVVEPVTN
ncbi:hypothetical protein ACE1AT_25870 [Pelatocladus sp. BLCC-F211]|uniref:hypothetical protein n=1 Tax=Pelatocladus sp. BLCC-F211 TaxID=3342752 RepID=UPI0035BB335A